MQLVPSTSTLTRRLLGATALSLLASLGLAQTGPTGFVISIDGEALVGDARVRDVARQTDVQLAEADVQVVYDGLGGLPRLDLDVLGTPRAYRAGDQVSLQSELNYPAYVERGELRIIDLGAAGGPRTVQVLDIAPNGRATLTLPEGENLAVVHRVYDAWGRYDQTNPVLLSQADRRPQGDNVEDGSDRTQIRRIPVHGGAVRVSGDNVVSGAHVRALGEVIQPDASGGFVIERILPPGDYPVNVQVSGAGQRGVDLTRDVEIPNAEWFYVATADLTFGRRESDLEGDETWDSGRLAFYVDGHTASGLNITASADTGEGDLSDIFDRLEEKDPRSYALRVDPGDLFPTYGDDSTLVDNTPTSGRLYLRIERDGNYLLWGDFDAELTGAELIRNDRSLYGLQGVYATPQTMDNGEAQARIVAYGAQPDRLPQRDVFLGTGGSVYFLERQDISAASENLSIQVRDPISGRVIETVQLQAGSDYDINYIQGIVTLARPLSSSVPAGTLVSTSGGNPDINLVAQYEYTPVAGDVDGYTYGLRGEVWLTQDLRLGVTGLVEQTGIADQEATGADLLWQHSEATYVTLEYAHTDGPGFGQTYSADGGLVVDTIATATGSGEAWKFGARADFADLNLSMPGHIGTYYETRTMGFSTLDHQVTATTGDETLWGLYAEANPQGGLQISAYYDSYENAVGEHDYNGGLQAEWDLAGPWSLGAGIEHLDRNKGTDIGARTDLAIKLGYALSDDAMVYGLAQSTLDRDGLDRNDRYGLGGRFDLANGWIIEAEVTDGTDGTGARLLASRDDGLGSTSYFGYDLDPGRDYPGTGIVTGTDLGRVVMGGSQAVNDNLTYFGESTWDGFGDYQSLTNAYGLTYVASDALTTTASIELGQVRDDAGNDFDRTALTFGATYQTDMMSASGRVEYRVEDGERSGLPLSTDTLAVSADLSYKLDEERRFVASLDAAQTETTDSALLDGDYVDLTLGYAYRPIDNDRLNLLARYRYLYDTHGQRVDDSDEDGPRQRSHVFSLNAIYEVSDQWELGGKLGFRLSDTAADSTSDYISNDAWLAVANARYHMVHNWDALLELRHFQADQSGFSESSALGAIYRHVGDNAKIGVGYNFGSFSDDLTDLVFDDRGAFINLIAKF